MAQRRAKSHSGASVPENRLTQLRQRKVRESKSVSVSVSSFDPDPDPDPDPEASLRATAGHRWKAWGFSRDNDTVIAGANIGRDAAPRLDGCIFNGPKVCFAHARFDDNNPWPAGIDSTPGS
jgi:hypothetical protein